VKRLAIILIALAAAFASPAASDEVIPLVQMENVPLTDALRQLARKARLNVILDPKLSHAPYSTMTVSIRWEKVTAREALIALLDNHGLVLVESSRAPAR
jgi:hypothetical protein